MLSGNIMDVDIDRNTVITTDKNIYDFQHGDVKTQKSCQI